MTRFASLLALAASTLALTGVAHGQQTTPPTPASAPEGVQQFQPAFFARFNPVTAEDMVRQLPGFTLDEGADLRGFGATAGGDVLQRFDGADGRGADLRALREDDAALISGLGRPRAAGPAGGRFRRRGASRRRSAPAWA